MSLKSLTSPHLNRLREAFGVTVLGYADDQEL